MGHSRDTRYRPVQQFIVKKYRVIQIIARDALGCKKRVIYIGM